MFESSQQRPLKAWRGKDRHSELPISMVGTPWNLPLHQLRKDMSNTIIENDFILTLNSQVLQV